jgi:predicted P-loop ATPase
MSQLSIAQYAKIYTERYNWHLVPIEAGRKYPTKQDWGNTALSEPAQAFAYWELHKNWNMGCALANSAMCSLDIDDEAGWLLIMEEFGIPADALDTYPTIKGRGKRVMFRVPEHIQLPYCKVNWPKQDEPKKHYTIVELRAATDGSQKQDVLPPSQHPDTGRPYEWIVKPPKTLAEWPTPPDWLLAIWTAWDAFKPQLQGVCPWLPKPERKALPQRAQQPQQGMPDVQGAYNSAYPIESTLEVYGYKRRGKRYLSPHSGTGLAGVHIMDDNKCWIHHASDPLCSEESGKPVSSYDLFCYYECNGDYSKAFKSAAALLSIQLRAPVQVREHIEQPVIEYDEQTHAPMHYDADPSSPLPFCTEKGVPLAHISNLKEICRRLGVQVRYNVISKEEEVIIPNQSFSLDNEGNASLAWLESECSLFKMPTSKLPGFVTYIADQNQHNPVANWVTSKPWDGQDHLGALLDTVTIKDAANMPAVVLKDTLITRWMISAIAGAFSPKGVSASGVLVFQGDQYVGKTKWFKSLVPEDLNLIKDGVILKPDDRDSVKQAVSFWLVELGELDSTFRKSDIAALKAFLTNDKDVLRRAYARKESQYARRTVFFGSVNPKEFLHDPTGNRRYWTIEVAKLDHSHTIDMQQVWAQVYEQWKVGASHYLTPDEMGQLNSHNEEFTASDPIEELMQQCFDWSTKQDYWRWITATDAVRECGYERPSKADCNTAAAAIRKLNGGNVKRTNAAKLMLVPPKRFD